MQISTLPISNHSLRLIENMYDLFLFVEKPETVFMLDFL